MHETKQHISRLKILMTKRNAQYAKLSRKRQPNIADTVSVLFV